MTIFRRSLRLLPAFAALLLSGCGYVHFGRYKPAEENTALAAENAALREQLAQLSAARTAAEPAAANMTSAPEAAAAAPATPPAEVDASHLADIESKLSTALRSYSLLQEENDRLKATAEKLAAEKSSLESQLASSTSTTAELNDQLTTSAATARLVETLRTQLRQTQDQLNALIAEYTQLRTRSALGAQTSSSGMAVPTRPGTPSALLSTSPERLRAASTLAPVDLQTPAAAAPRTHTVADGDTLSKIARQYYGDSQRWPEILDANRAQLPDDRSLRVGMKLRIP